MAMYLKSLGAIVAVGGILLGFGFLHRGLGDEEYTRARLARDRNPGNVLFESELRIAEGKRVFLFYSSAACFLTGIIGGSLLWGVGSLHTRLARRSAILEERILEATNRGDTWA